MSSIGDRLAFLFVGELLFQKDQTEDRFSASPLKSRLGGEKCVHICMDYCLRLKVRTWRIGHLKLQVAYLATEPRWQEMAFGRSRQI